MQFKSLSTRLSALIGVGLVGAIAVMVVVAVWGTGRMERSVREHTERVAREAVQQRIVDSSQVAAQRFTALFDRAYAESATLAAALTVLDAEVKSGRLSPQAARLQGTALVRAVLDGAPDVLGVFVASEANGLLGSDAPFAGKADTGSNDAGRFAPYWARADGGVMQEPSTQEQLNDSALQDNGSAGNDWFACPLKQNRGCIIEPYLDEVDKVEVLMSSTSAPVMIGGRAVAVTGIDFRLDRLSEMAEAQNRNLFGGAGRTIFLSASGLIVGDSAGKGDAGKALAANHPLRELRGDAPIVHFDADGVVRAYVPVRIANGLANWAIAVELPEATVLADVVALTESLRDSSRWLLSLQLMAGLVVGALALAAAFAIARAVAKPIETVTLTLQQIAGGGGDLTHELPRLSDDEVGRLAEAFNAFLASLRQLIGQMKNTAQSVSNVAEKTAGLAERSATGIEAQRSEIDMIATAITQMSSAIQEVARSATHAADAADTARKNASDGQRRVNDTVGAISEVAEDVNSAVAVIRQLADDSARINGILDVISSIADQTNLLALNAAIEAARAGDQGRGFAVVADEVRQLAQRTRTATSEIQQMIATLNEGSDRAVQVMDRSRQRAEHAVARATRAGEALDGINSSVATISDMNTQIAAAVTEQGTVTDELTRNITTIRDVAQDLSADAAESDQAGRVLHHVADELMGNVGKFRT